MFTVIICSNTIRKNCTDDYGDFLVPFIKNGDFAFCDWNPSGNSLSEAVPELADIIHNKSQWRALIVLDAETYGKDNISKRNPYNYIDAVSGIKQLTSADEIIAFRDDWDVKLKQAVSNPLVKLGMWLSGAPSSEYPAVNPEYSSLPSVTDEMYFEELRKRNLQAAEVELDYLLAKKGEVISGNFTLEGEIHNKPTEVIALCERMHINDNDECNSAWKVKQEHAYSRFYEDNLYSDRLLCFVSDIDYINGARVEKSYFNFLILLLMFARKEVNGSGIRFGKLYRVNLNLNREKMNSYCCRYLDKLRATVGMINRLKMRISSLQQEPLNRKTFEDTFISDVDIPVDINNEFDTKKLFCKNDNIGLSRDCPTEEYDYWYNQYRKIEKEFVRYIREPRRAVQTAVQVDFRNSSSIDDDRVSALNEFQLEDINIRLFDEEEAMIKTRTTQLFKTDEYMNRMEEADKSVRKNIFQRMTKKNTIIASAAAIGAYAFGFIPLFFSGSEELGSFGFSAVIFAVVIALFAAMGFVCISVFKKRLKDRFSHFNYEMSGILSSIKDGLKGFSDYLSHASNVMREFSVIKNTYSEKNHKIHIIGKHEFYILQQMKKAQSLFYSNINLEHFASEKQEPYNYDFTKDKIYDYSILSVTDAGRGYFLNSGVLTEFPVDYIESVDIKREELYD